ncbi:MAG: amidohydrolase family protein [Anaerolineales bacterium]|nr:amidohydrolase family protein [Anaerolineales bacterium]
MLAALTHALQVTVSGLMERRLVYRVGSQIVPHTSPAHREIDLSGYALYAGLINAHDHLELNHYPRTKFREVYTNAHQWGEDVSSHLHESPYREGQAYPLWERCWIGGLKNLLSGVTTVAHHNPLHRPLQARWFPVRVVQRYGWSHSLHFETPTAIQRSYQRTPPTAPWLIHLAEGTDTIAVAELGQLGQLGALGSNTVLIHGVGITNPQPAIERGVGLVWCPSTNHDLLGQTAQVGAWSAAGQLALGSDSRLTADGDLLDELRAAYATGQVDAPTLLQLVTTNPARLLRLSKVGDLQVGYHADFIALPRQADPYRALIEARRADIALVVKGGRVMFGDPDLVRQFSGRFVEAELDGRPKLINVGLAARLQRSSLQETGLILGA